MTYHPRGGQQFSTWSHSESWLDFNMNGDGRRDIAAAQMHQGAPPQEVVVFVNESNGVRWAKHVVSKRGSHDIQVADIDGNGRPDILGTNHSGSYQPVELWLNQAAPANKINP